jgi:glucose/arabinose dehydrogenase
MRRTAGLAIVVVVLTGCGGGGASDTTTATQSSRTDASSPAAHATAPTVVASGIPFPTNLAFDKQGRLWVSSGVSGPNKSDGVWYAPRGGHPVHVAKGLTAAFGLAWLGDKLYVAHIASPTSGRVTMLDGFTGTSFKHQSAAIDGVPVGVSTLGSIIPGPGGRLYFGAGRTADEHGMSGRVLSFAPGQRRPTLEASGLHSAFGLAFAGSQLLLTDGQRNDLGPHKPFDELNAFDPSGHVANFGYPKCYEPGGPSCPGTQRPLVTMPPHASPVGVAVRGNVAYVAEAGSRFTQNPTGSDIQRVDLSTGKRSQFWRSPVPHDPVGAAIGPDGDLYVTLYASGKVVRFPL